MTETTTEPIVVEDWGDYTPMMGTLQAANASASDAFDPLEYRLGGRPDTN